MPSSAYNKFHDFAEQVLKAKHDFSSHTFKLALTNTAPLASNTVLADIAEIAATGGYAAGGYVLDTVIVTEAGGSAKVTVADETITAAGGSIGPFRYAILYNDSTTAPLKALVAYYDYGSSITLGDGESIDVDLDAVNGIFGLG
jgi:hypothetical protein